MRVTPSLPQRGRQTKGSIPLDPLSFSYFRREFLINVEGAITYFMNASAEVEAKVATTQKNAMAIFPWTLQCQILENLLAPPCLGEALRRVYLTNLILMEGSSCCPFFDYISKRNYDVFHLMSFFLERYEYIQILWLNDEGFIISSIFFRWHRCYRQVAGRFFQQMVRSSGQGEREDQSC